MIGKFKVFCLVFFFNKYFRVPETCPRLLINREKVGHKSGITAILGMGGGMDFDGKNNTRDVAWLGDCDEGCMLLAEKLGWGVSALLFTMRRLY